MINALTIDVEDYFQVTTFEGSVKRESWDSYPVRVVDDTVRILDILDSFGVHATFFVLGWVALKSASLIKEIHRRGHEVASHGYDHRLIYKIGPEKFREDIVKSKKILEDICGHGVIGYRAPTYSITDKSQWALEILREEGFLYDSSIFPIIHDLYGMPHADRFPHDIKTRAGVIKEFPLSTIEFGFGRGRCRIPIAGGGYLRLIPLILIKKAIEHINTREKQTVVIYFHPWEIDPDQPRIKANLVSSFRHYINLNKTIEKIKGLLSDFRFDTMRNVLGIR